MADDRAISKTLSYWLRHRPDAADLTLDGAGWTDVDAVFAALAGQRINCDWERLLSVVETNDKQRYELSADSARIRATQGHSITVELDWPRREPPELLYHGTVDRFLTPIRADGLRPMRRHHVHLSPDIATATIVGNRRGKAVILTVRAGDLARSGRAFFLTGNGVWLTDHVPPAFLSEG
ncbi:MAG: RNA 2'-phosphotransferase [Pseudomonadota bacterium]